MANKQIAIVTGASTGIGFELAKECARNGFDLLIAADEPAIETAADTLRAHGTTVEAVQADLATVEGNDALIAAIGARPVAALLANAGRGLGRGFVDQDWNDVRRVIDTNVTGTTYLLHKLLPGMKARGAGRVLITGSIAGFMPGTYQAVYNATKAYLDSISFAIRAELKDTGVTVTCLMPGATETDFFERADMMDTKVGTAKKDDAAMVAKTGYDAMMRGDGDIVSGWHNKLQSAIATITPSGLLAEAHRKMGRTRDGRVIGSHWGRRAALGAAVAALGATAASADQPDTLRGHAEGDRVELPKLHAESEVEGAIPNPDPLARRLGIAVVGLGHLSLDQILPGTLTSKHVRVTALVSGDRAKARVVAGQYGVPEANLYDYAGFDRIRDNPAIDAVYIVLPNDMHMEYTLRAAQAGKHVLCEKPMTTNVADAERMIAACREAKRLLMIAYRMQYDPYHRTVIKMVRGGELGPLRAISAVNGQNDVPNGQWRQVLKQAGGGSLPDVGIYCLSAARYITGEEPIEITAQLTQPKDDPRFREIEDLCAFTLRFPSGVLAQCMSGYSHHEARRLSVLGRDATIEMDPAFSYQGLSMRIGRKAGQAYALEQRRFAEKNQFAREMDHFAECVRTGRTPHTPGEEGLQDQRLVAAIYQAARGGSVVKLPPISGLDTTRGPPPSED